MHSHPTLDRRLCLAPMMGYTDRHCRALFHMIDPQLLVYTEMVTSAALLHGDRDRLLAHGERDAPCALQLGGSDPVALSRCATMAEDQGYQEVNLNIGCPSNRVQQGDIGACLMADPERVAACVHEMQNAVDIPVTVKCRIGIDEQDSYEFFETFIETVQRGGCRVFIVHARKAILKGLSPKENRAIPPLRYDYLYRLKEHYPNLSIILNGGLKTCEDIQEPSQSLDGVMIGRAAMKNPMLMAGMAQLMRGLICRGPVDVFRDYLGYLGQQIAAGEPPRRMVKHLLNLFHGQPGARHYRRILSEEMQGTEFSLAELERALEMIAPEELLPC